MTIETFVGLLDGAKQTRRGWQARCPAHADKSPSLTICEGQDHRLLIHCFGGCTVTEICTALHLTLRDLFPNSEKPVSLARQERRLRRADRLLEERKEETRGAAIDVAREAEQLVKTAKGIDISRWSDAKLDQELDRIADAYDVLRREGVMYES
jgi:DNA primase